MTLIDRFDRHIDQLNTWLLGNPELATNSAGRFEWQLGNVKRKDCPNQYYAREGGEDWAFLFFVDHATGNLRKAREPLFRITLNLGTLSFMTPVFYCVTVALRICQLAQILFVVFYHVFETVYQEESTDLSTLFAKSVNKEVLGCKENFTNLKDKVKNDAAYAAVMEVSALRGWLSADPFTITKMGVYYSEAEYLWNNQEPLSRMCPEMFWRRLGPFFLRPERSQGTFWNEVVQIGKTHNKKFVLYQCLYPLGNEYKSRFKKLESFGAFSTYDEAYEAQKKWNERSSLEKGVKS